MKRKTGAPVSISSQSWTKTEKGGGGETSKSRRETEIGREMSPLIFF